VIRSVIQVHPRELYSEVHPDRDVRPRHHYGTRSTIQSPPACSLTQRLWRFRNETRRPDASRPKSAIHGSTRISCLLRRRLSLIIIPESVCGVSEIFYAFLWFPRQWVPQFLIKPPSPLCFRHASPHIPSPTIHPTVVMSFETSRLSVDALLDLILMKLPEEARNARYCSDSEVRSVPV
jgi:hypothetical protein